MNVKRGSCALMFGLTKLHSERFLGVYPKDIQKEVMISYEGDLSVLLLTKGRALIASIERTITQRFRHKVEFGAVKTEAEFTKRLADHEYDIIIMDHAVMGANAALSQAAAVCPQTPVIFVGRMMGEDRIVSLLRQGAVDYVLKDRIGRLPYAVMRALQDARTVREKRHIEAMLDRSLKHLAEAQRVAHMGSFEYNCAQHRIVWSDGVFRIFGLDPIKSYPMPETIFGMLDVPDRERIIAGWQQVMEGQTSLDENFRFTHADGSRRWVHLCAQLSTDELTGEVLMTGTVQDITEAKAARQEADRRAEIEHIILALSREWINASSEKFDQVMSDTMRVLAGHCCTDWAALYRFDYERQAAICQYRWRQDGQQAYVPDQLPLLPIVEILNGCVEAELANILVERPGAVHSFCAFALRSDGSLWGMLACGETHNEGVHPESNLINLFCEMLISVLRRRERERTLQEACENNRLILDSISDGFCTFSENGMILDICKGLAGRFGKTIRECIGLKLLDLFPEERYGDLGAKRMAMLDKTFQTRKTVKFVDSRDGRWYHNRFYPVLKDGRITAVSLFSTDITDKQKADEEYRQIILLEKEAQMLRQKEQEYLEMLDGSTVGSWIYDVQSGIMSFSSQWEKRLGIQKESATPLESYYNNVLHPEDRTWAIAESTRILQSGSAKYKMEYRLKTVDGGYIWILAQGKIIYNPNGAAVKIYGTSIDITDRKRMEEVLRENQKLLTMIIEGISDHIFLKDRESRMVMINSAVTRYLNLTSGDIIGKSEMEYFADKQQAWNVIQNDRRIIESGQEETVEEMSGDRVFLSKKAPWRDANGNVIGLFGISRDITDRINMITELERTAEELSQKNQLITDFFINISHEFKTPISIMMISTELIEQFLAEGLSDIQSMRSNVNYIHQNLFRLSRLVNNLLDITKIDAGFMQPRLVNRDIAYMLRYLVLSLQPYARRKDVAIIYSGPETELFMPTDMIIIDRILLNLVSNALKHTPKGGRIEVGCKALKESVCITVRDNGEGIPEDKQEIIFDRFRQVNTTLARSSEGCGIGLALVKSLVLVLGGSIGVRSEPGAGSEFSVELPRLQAFEPVSIEADGLLLDQRIEIELSDI